MKTTHLIALASAALSTILSYQSEAANIAVWNTDRSESGLDAQIILGGGTPFPISSLTSNSLADVDVLILLNRNPRAYDSGITSAIVAISDFVAAGGKLHFYDRAVARNDATLNSILPGPTTIMSVRTGSDDLMLLPGAGDLGYYGGLDDSSYDGGTASAQGFVFASSLPSGSVTGIAFQNQPERIVDFEYDSGFGSVHYSTIPADYYLIEGPQFIPDITRAMRTTITNLAVVSVPEPSAAMLLGICVLGFAFGRRPR